MTDGVFIEGLKIPSSCADCPCYNAEYLYCNLRNSIDINLDTRPSDCPLIPAADVLPRDEAIKMGAELAAMHGSDATSQQLEEAYLKGVEDGMTRRDVRPVVRGKWIARPYMMGNTQYCSLCGENYGMKHNFCPNCGAVMEES